MKNLIKKILKESDGLEWIRTTDINPWVEYDGIHFDIEPSEGDVFKYIEMVLNNFDVLNSDSWESPHKCDINSIIEYFHNEKIVYLVMDNEGRLSYGTVLVHWIDGGELNLIKYSQLKGGNTITESDDLDWIRDAINQPINPWEEYEAIIFDVVPTKEDVNMYIELCLNTVYVKNSTAWVDRRDDILAIISYVKNRGNAYLSLVMDYLGMGNKDSGSDLLYGYDLYRDQKTIKYSELKAFNLNESDDLDWIRNTESPRIQKNKSYIMAVHDLQQFLTTVELELPEATWCSGVKPTRFTPPIRAKRYIKIIINNYGNLSYSHRGSEDFSNSTNWP